jgi:hypothetical protein
VLELGDQRRQRRLRAMRRAEVAQAGVRFGADRLLERCDQARFADSGFAPNEDHATFVDVDLPPAAQQQLDLLVAPDEGRLPRTQRLEAARNRALSQHPRALDRRCRAVHTERPECLIFEKLADQPARARGDGDRAGDARGLQPCRELRRFADDAALRRLGRSVQVADHHYARRDANTRMQAI